MNKYIYIYLLIYYLPGFTVPEKKPKNPWSVTRAKNISNHGPEEKRKYANSRIGGGFWWIKAKQFFLRIVEVKLPDDPLRWNFSRRFSTSDLS